MRQDGLRSVLWLRGCACAVQEADALHTEMLLVLKCCVDPTKCIMDAVTNVFPVDR